MLSICQATLVSPTEGIQHSTLLIEDGQILTVGPADQVPCPKGAQILDAEGLFLVPGFIDLQCNGGFGYDLTDDPGSMWALAEKLPQYGVTTFLPTIITSPRTIVEQARQHVLNHPADFAGADPLGLHVEGPFINPEKKGAHNADYLRRPEFEWVHEWRPETGVRLVTLAPELDHALEVVKELVAQGVVVSAGHSMATVDQAQAGFQAGIRYGTHLFNAMPPMHHREPGLIGALLSDKRLTMGIIVDGIHLHPAVIKTVWEILGDSRMTLVTDAMAAMGMQPGRYVLGELEVLVDKNSARLADGTLAGSILTMDEALKNLIAFTDCTLEDGLTTITTTPAKLLGLDKQRGDLKAGMRADMVLLDANLDVVTTIANGEIVYSIL